MKENHQDISQSGDRYGDHRGRVRLPVVKQPAAQVVAKHHPHGTEKDYQARDRHRLVQVLMHIDRRQRPKHRGAGIIKQTRHEQPLELD